MNMNPVGQIAARMAAEKMAILQEAQRLVAKAIAQGWARVPASPAKLAPPTAAEVRLPEIKLPDLKLWVVARQLTPRQAAEALGFGYLEFTAALRGERTLRGKLPP